jgi:cytoskeletal protein CcmA (bactofilin family)
MGKKATMSAFLAEGSKFEGKIKFSGILRIDGVIKGDILEGSTLFVGDKAVIEGNIHVTHVVLTGEIRGNIAAERVEVRPPGQVFGSIEARTALIDEGAVFVGNCRILQPKETLKTGRKAPKKDPRAPEENQGEKSDAKSGKSSSSEIWTEESVKRIDKQDTLGPFFQDYCEISSNDQVQAQTFYLVYRNWCEFNGKPPLTSVMFGKMMTEKFEKVDLAGKRFYKGIRLTTDSLKS